MWHLKFPIDHLRCPEECYIGYSRAQVSLYTGRFPLILKESTTEKIEAERESRKSTGNAHSKAKLYVPFDVYTETMLTYSRNIPEDLDHV